MNAPTPPLELTRPVDHDAAVGEAVRDAINAALAGDWTKADRLELDYRNLLARIGEFKVRNASGVAYAWFDEGGLAHVGSGSMETHAPFVVAIRRGFARDGRGALEWQLLEKCRRCDGRLRRLPCSVCEGRWYVEDMDEHEVVYTDLEGVLLEEAA